MNFDLKNRLSEITLIEAYKNQFKDFADFEVLGYSQGKDAHLPIYKISFGTKDPSAPVLGLIGGVHGLERIGSQVTLALMNSLVHLLLWDKNIQNTLKNIRLFFIPTVNPVGILKRTRCNPRGVDLMRNAPVEAQGDVHFLLGGHRYSSKLPWYRGNENEMEVETSLLIKAVQDEIRHASVAMTVDFHSGFGVQDQIWFPYAKSRKPLPDLAYLQAFFNLMESTYPNHFYKIEPQAYLTHGDLWDYLYDWNLSRPEKHGLYLPFSLEMGSWSWVKKNPLQILFPEGAFHPMKSHRVKRALRRHNTFFEFLIRSLSSYENWSQLSEGQKMSNEQAAREKWYDRN